MIQSQNAVQMSNVFPLSAVQQRIENNDVMRRTLERVAEHPPHQGRDGRPTASYVTLDGAMLGGPIAVRYRVTGEGDATRRLALLLVDVTNPEAVMTRYMNTMPDDLFDTIVGILCRQPSNDGPTLNEVWADYREKKEVMNTQGRCEVVAGPPQRSDVEVRTSKLELED